MKRSTLAVALLLGAVLLAMPALLFAAASAEQPAAPAVKKAVVLKMWGGVPPEAGPQKAVEAFNKQYADKGITIEYERFVNDDQGNLKLETYLLSGSDIDVYISYTRTALLKRAQGNMAMDLTELIKKDKIDINAKFGEATTKLAIDGKYYSIPTVAANNHGLLINKNMFDDAGIPVPTAWTFDEFREIAKKLTKGEGQNKVFGFYMNTAQHLTYPIGFAATNIGADASFKPGFKESNYDHPAFEKAFQTVTDMMLVDKTAVSHVDTITQKLTIESVFLAGKAAISIGPWIIRSIKNTQQFPHDFLTAFAPLPVMDKNSKAYRATDPGDLVSINPKSKNIDAAWEFVKWYADTGILELSRFGRFPYNPSIDVNKVADALMTGAEKILDGPTLKSVMLSFPPNPMFAAFTAPPETAKVASEEVEAMYTGKKTVQQALADMKMRTDKILKEAR